MRFLSIIDPIDGLNHKSDSSIEIMRESGKRGIKTYFCTDLGHDRTLFADAFPVEIRDNGYRVGKGQRLPVDSFDLVLMRKEPPYDLHYHHMTLLLQHTKAPVVNSSQGLRNANEKLVALNFPDLIPRTLVSQDMSAITAFIKKYEKAVIKPVDLFGGKNVFLLEHSTEHNRDRIETVTMGGSQYAIVQEFMEDVFQGDKRILLLNGEPLGAIRRIPGTGEFRANMAIGGTPKKTALTGSDLRIISRIRPYLIKEGLYFAGIDVIGDRLIEINVTCPTGIIPIKEINKKNITSSIVDFLEHVSTRNKKSG
ncbi:MAG: glutathione synthase [archaeon]